MTDNNFNGKFWKLLDLDGQGMKKYLESKMTNGMGISRKLAEEFGLPYPPKKGWKTKLIREAQMRHDEKERKKISQKYKELITKWFWK